MDALSTARPDTTSDADRFVLFLGNTQPRSAASRLKASGIRYVRKRLESRPENWESILSYLNAPGLICVVGQLNTTVFNRFASARYAEVAPTLLAALSRVPHILFAHEAVMTGQQPSPRSDDDQEHDDDVSLIDYLQRSGYFISPTEEVRTAVTRFFEQFQVRLIPYSSNAEFEVMADGFIEDNERDLLFRVYVPAGRLYAAEAAKLLSLFRDWLSKVGRKGIRQDGYETGAGHMYEFYGDGRPRSEDLSEDFKDFSGFLELCVENPRAAEDQLSSLGFNQTTSSGIVARYGKEARRLRLDLKQERELRLMAIRHQLETDVLEASIGSGDVSREAVERLVDALVPAPGHGLAGMLGSGVVTNTPPEPVQVQVNQQIINAVEGTVVQSVQGTANVGPQAQELLNLIARYAGPDADTLTTAVYEFEDPDAGAATRVTAKQLLKGFLIKVAGVAEEVATTSLMKYIEKKIGI